MSVMPVCCPHISAVAVPNIVPAPAGGSSGPPSTSDINAFGWGVFYSMAEGDSDLFTDLGLTAANVGDPVRQINDLSGNARHAIAPGANQRPVLQADRSVLLDGVDDWLSFANTGSALGLTAVVTIDSVTAPFNAHPLNSVAAGFATIKIHASPHRVQLYGPGLTGTHLLPLSSALTDKVTITVTISAAGVAKLYENGVYSGTFTGTATTGWIWNQLGQSAASYNGRIYNVGVKPDGVLTDEQILQYAQWAGTAA